MTIIHLWFVLPLCFPIVIVQWNVNVGFLHQAIVDLGFICYKNIYKWDVKHRKKPEAIIFISRNLYACIQKHSAELELHLFVCRVCLCAHVFECLCMFECVCVHLCVCACMCLRMCEFVWAFRGACVHQCLFVHVSVCITKTSCSNMHQLINHN